MTCNTFTLTVTDNTLDCYFDDYDVAEAWGTNPANMVDGDIDTYATTTYNPVGGCTDHTPAGSTQYCNSQSCPSDNLGTITKVEIRAFSLANRAGCTSAAIIKGGLRPVFSAGDGDNHTYIPPTGDSWVIPAPNWCEWIDITNDTNAPATWTFTDIYNLGVDHFPIYTSPPCGDILILQTYKIEIRVTYDDSVTLNNPLIGGLDNGLNKELKSFNLWTNYTIHDIGISNQPLTLTGIDHSEEGEVCFPLCFPLCFHNILQDKFQKIHEWMDDNKNIKIDSFGDCFNGIYAIKNFRTESMRSPYGYRWFLDIEKVDDL